MSELAIKVEDLGKQFHIGSTQKRNRTLRDAITDTMTGPVRRVKRVLRGQGAGSANTEKFWALKDVSFEIKRGEVVGIIGRNGAGKSTLLKILSQITEPSEGYADIYGRVGALLEVGTGFHLELTGRENIYLNGAILGMTRGEIDRKFDEIVAFAGVEKFIDTPVKHFSSGMGLRLGFAVAAHLEPEILVVDEVLAVGDAAFQQKCIGKMGDVAKEGRTVLFVSHNMAAVSVLCTKAFMLSGGQLAATGAVNDIIGKYMESTLEVSRTPIAERTDRQGDGRVRFTDVTLIDENGNYTAQAISGRPLTMLLGYETADGKPINYINAQIWFYGTFGELLFVCETRLGRGGRFEEIPAKGHLACHIPKIPVTAGSYRFSIGIKQSRYLDKLDDAGTLVVEAGDFYGTGQLPGEENRAAVMVPHGWDIYKNG